MTTFASVLQQLARAENPYPGLRHFDTGEAHLFYGRDEQLVELAARLERSRFVAVVGLSGSGKSSLVRAGLIPALHHHLLGARDHWRVAITRPSGSPIANLAASLRERGIEPYDLRRSSQALARVAQQLDERESLLLVVDQFEELFRYKEVEARSEDHRRRRDEAAAEAADFVDLLLAATRREPPVFVVLTMRSDYLGDCAEFTGLPEALNESQYLVPRLSRAQLRLAIEGPLGCTAMEPALVQRILNDFSDEPDELPVLQHALMRTWSHWRRSDLKNRPIGLEDYEAVGGFANALNRHAEELLGRDVVRKNPKTVEHIFRRLTARGQSNRERRDPATLAELWAVCGADSDAACEHVKKVVDLFRSGDATFLVPREANLDAGTYIDITHESLIRCWTQLRDDWLPKEQASAREFASLADWARDWKGRRREVLRGLDLKAAMEWDRDRNSNPGWALHYADGAALEEVSAFLEASKWEERRRASAERRKLLLVGGAALVLAALAVALIYYSRAAHRAEDSAHRAEDSARRARDVASAQKLAAVAKLMRETEPDKTDLGLLLAIESLKLAQTPEGSEELWRTTRLLATPTVRLQHQSPVSSVAFGPDPYIVALPSGNEAVLWNRNTRKQEGPYTHSQRVNAFALSPNGEKVATVSADGEVKLWATRTRRLLWTRKHNGAVNQAAFSGNGRFVATASDDGTARVWIVESGGERASVRHESAVEVVALNDSGESLATAGNDGPARLWRLADRRLLGEMPHSGPVTALAFIDQDNGIASQTALIGPEMVLSAGYDGAIRVWQPEPFKLNAVIHAAAPSFALENIERLSTILRFERPGANGPGRPVEAALPFSDSKLMHVRLGGRDDLLTVLGKTAQFWLLRPGQTNRVELERIVSRARTTSIAVREEAIREETDRAATSSADGDVQVWDLGRGSPMERRIPGDSSLSADTTRLASATEDGVAIYDAPFTAPRFRISWPGKPLPYAAIIRQDRTRPGEIMAFSDARFSARLSADGHVVAARDARGNVWLWDVEKQTLLRRIAGHPLPEFTESFFAVTSNRLLLAADRRLESIDAATGTIAGRIEADSAFIQMLLSKDNRYAAAQTRSGQLYVIPAGGWRAATPVKSTERALQMAFSPDGSRIALCGPEEKVGVVETKSLDSKSISLLSACQSVAFDPTGQMLIAGKAEGAEVWDVRSGQRRSVFSSQFPVTAAAFSSDGTVIATVGNRVLHVRRFPGLEELERIPGVTEGSLQFADKDRFIVAGKQFLYWRPEEVIPAACEKATRNLTAAERDIYLPEALTKTATCQPASK